MKLGQITKDKELWGKKGRQSNFQRPKTYQNAAKQKHSE